MSADESSREHAPGDDPTRDLDPEIERRIAEVLREDEDRAVRASLAASDATPEEDEFVASLRAQVATDDPVPRSAAIAGEAESATRGRGAWLRNDRRTEPRRRDRRWLHIGAAAATIGMLAAATVFAVRSSKASEVGPEDPPGPIYMGPDDVETPDVTLVPLPSVVDWSDEVDSLGPYVVVVRDARPPRLDEGRDIAELEETVLEPRWSCPPERHSLLPDVFWVYVYDELQPPGSPELWSSLFSRP